MAHTPTPVGWPSNKVTRVPFNVFTDPRQYALEIERIFKGPVWHYLCLEAELPVPGSYVTDRIAETPIVVTRDGDGSLHAFVNRCAHRGALLCLEPRGRLEHITCVYHSWSYNLRGELTGVAFQRGVKSSGGMPEDFRKEDHALRRLQVTTFAAWCSARSPTRCRRSRTTSAPRSPRASAGCCTNRCA